MRQKVLIGAALLHDPEVLVLDEPLSGLDVTSVLVMKALLRELAARGRTILYSTHHLEVAESLCERVLILHDGRVVADDSVANLRELRRRPSLEEIFSTWVLDDRPEATAARIAQLVSGCPGGGVVTPRRVLVRHFLRQFASFEAVVHGRRGPVRDHRRGVAARGAGVPDRRRDGPRRPGS